MLLHTHCYHAKEKSSLKRTEGCKIAPPTLTSASLINSDISIPFSFVYDRLLLCPQVCFIYGGLYTCSLFYSGTFNDNLKLCFFTFFFT